MFVDTEIIESTANDVNTFKSSHNFASIEGLTQSSCPSSDQLVQELQPQKSKPSHNSDNRMTATQDPHHHESSPALPSNDDVSDHSLTNLREQVTESQYVSSSAILYLYYNDLESVLEEHFSKALRASSSPHSSSSFSSNEKHKSESKTLSLSLSIKPLEFHTKRPF
jgi:hypothetical protein